MRSVNKHLEDALANLMLAEDAARLFHHDQREIEKIRLLIRATNKVRSESQPCTLSKAPALDGEIVTVPLSQIRS